MMTMLLFSLSLSTSSNKNLFFLSSFLLLTHLHFFTLFRGTYKNTLAQTSPRQRRRQLRRPQGPLFRRRLRDGQARVVRPRLSPHRPRALLRGHRGTRGLRRTLVDRRRRRRQEQGDFEGYFRRRDGQARRALEPLLPVDHGQARKRLWMERGDVLKRCLLSLRSLDVFFFFFFFFSSNKKRFWKTSKR